LEAKQEQQDDEIKALQFLVANFLTGDEARYTAGTLVHWRSRSARLSAAAYALPLVEFTIHQNTSMFFWTAQCRVRDR
jgi:hypothetical protein